MKVGIIFVTLVVGGSITHLLDNAIDAASECDEKILNIIFRNEPKNSRNIILIENLAILIEFTKNPPFILSAS